MDDSLLVPTCAPGGPALTPPVVKGVTHAVRGRCRPEVFRPARGTTPVTPEMSRKITFTFDLSMNRK